MNNTVQVQQQQQKEKRKTMECYLSDDFLLKEIVPKLPAKSILNFKRVSRTWLSRISSDSNFIADHTLSTASADHPRCHIVSAFYVDHNHNRDRITNNRIFVTVGPSKFVELATTHIAESMSMDKPVPHFDLVGSGNGLVCLTARFADNTFELVVWNPLTREFKRVQPPGADSARRPRWAKYYFGVPKGSDDYKLVCLHGDWDDDQYAADKRHIVYAKLLSKSKSSWLPEQNNALSWFRLSPARAQGLTIDGAMYWLADYHRNDPLHGTTAFHIWSLDLRTEKIQVMQGPSQTQSCVTWDHFDLINWKGCLSVVMRHRSNSGLWRIFVKTDSNNWTTFDIDTWRFQLRGVAFLGDQLILSRYGDNSERFLYDLNANNVTSYLEDGLGTVFYYGFTCYTHTHTLVSPN